jgi:hypothetical protein
MDESEDDNALDDNLTDMMALLTLREQSEKESYEVLEVGFVVSKDDVTDSLIFRIVHPHMKGKVDAVQLLSRSGLNDHPLRLPEPSACPAAATVGTEVIVYGAMRRGETGVV